MSTTETPTREQATRERIAEPRAGQAAVPPDRDVGLPELARLAGNGPSDGVDQLRAQRVGSDAANVVGAKDLRGDPALAGTGGGCGWSLGRRHGPVIPPSCSAGLRPPCRAGRGSEPPRAFRRLFCVSHAARAVGSLWRWYAASASAGGRFPKLRGALFECLMYPVSQGLEPPKNPVRFRRSSSVGRRQAVWVGVTRCGSRGAEMRGTACRVPPSGRAAAASGRATGGRCGRSHPSRASSPPRTPRPARSVRGRRVRPRAGLSALRARRRSPRAPRFQHETRISPW